MSGADEDPVDGELPTPDGVAAAAGDRAGPSRHPSPRWHPSTKIVAGVALGVATLSVMYLARNALSLVALAGLIAFLVAPLIRFLRRRARFSPVFALLTSYVIALIGVVLIGGLVVGGVVTSLSEVDPPRAAASLRATATEWLTDVRRVQVGGYDVDLSTTVDPLLDSLMSADELDASADADDDADDADDASTIALGRDQVERLAGGLLPAVATVGGFLVTSLITLLVAIYLSSDSHRFHAAILANIPPQYGADAAAMSARLGEIWRGYLYGQLANSLATGVLVWLVLWAIGLPGAFVLGVVMALLNMIPTFGPIIAAVPGVVTAVALGSTRLEWSNLAFTLLVIAIYVVVVQLQANLMAPFITGRAVDMSPASVLVGLIVGYQVGGLVGTLLVVPVLASLKEAAMYVMAKLLDREPFADTAHRPAEAT